MIKEITREVVSIEDAKDMAYDGKVINYQITSNGYLCTFLEEVQDIMPIIKDLKNWIVFCNTNSGKMYVSDSGVSFNACDSKHFSEHDAKTKAYFMGLNGIYHWQAIAI